MKKFFTTLLLGSFLALSIAQQPPIIDAGKINLTSLDDVETDDRNIPLEELKSFVDIFNLVRLYYVDAVSSKQLMDNAIRGMLSRLDPHSVYFTSHEYSTYLKAVDGDYAGIGVDLDMKAGSVRIVSTIEGSPAYRAGLRSGDIISQINGQNVSELSLTEVDNLLTGNVGTDVKLLIIRDDKTIPYTLTREIIHAISVNSRLLDSNFIYLRINQFQGNTADSVQKEIESLRVKSSSINGAIIDLRNNPGGFLDSAVATSDLFLNSGVIVREEGRSAEDKHVFHATEGDILNGAPLVVLIDEGTASAAEIMAGALQENHRALIAGQQSFGKGSVQEFYDLTNGSALKLTTARYYTPSGASIQAKGIMPQVVLNKFSVTPPREDGANLRESAQPHHLQNKEASSRQVVNVNNIAEQDFPLYEAINLLTALSIFKTPTL